MIDLREYEGKRVAITGGLGMIGSSLAHVLVPHGADVLLIDLFLEPYGANNVNIAGLEDRVRVAKADIRDQNAMNGLLVQQDFVFDLAGQVGHNLGMQDPRLDLELNCLGHIYVLNACRHNSPNARIVFSGSRFQFGKIENNPVDESHPMKPLSIYGAHKVLGETYFDVYFRNYGLNTSSVRIANPYGLRSQMKHSHSNLVNWFIRQAMDDNALTVFGDGSQLRDYIYTEDLAKALACIGLDRQAAGQPFNIGSGIGTRFIDMANTVVETVGSGRVVKVPWPRNYENVETGDYVTDIMKTKERTGWLPQVSFKEGIEKTVDYYRKNKGMYW